MSNIYSVKAWLIITATCAAAVVLFFFPIIASGNIEKLAVTLPRILTDTEHQKRTLLEMFAGYFYSFKRWNGYGMHSLCMCAAMAILIAFDKHRQKHAGIYLFLSTIIAVLFSLNYLLMYKETAGYTFPIVVMGGFSFFLAEKKNTSAFVSVFIPGLVFSMCTYCSSNLELLSIMTAMIVSVPAAILFITELVYELIDRIEKNSIKREFTSFISVVAAAAVIFTFMCGMVEGRMKRVFFDKAPYELSAQFQCGTSKGLKSTPENVEKYDGQYEALAPLRDIKDGNVLYLTTESHLYLEDSKKCSSFSTWFGYIDPIEYKVERLKKYWELFPEKKPDYIYFDEDQAVDPDYLSAFNVNMNNVIELDKGFILCTDNKKGSA